MVIVLVLEADNEDSPGLVLVAMASQAAYSQQISEQQHVTKITSYFLEASDFLILFVYEAPSLIIRVWTDVGKGSATPD